MAIAVMAKGVEIVEQEVRHFSNLISGSSYMPSQAAGENLQKSGVTGVEDQPQKRPQSLFHPPHSITPLDIMISCCRLPIEN
ncbi:MAG: hypothetical protein JWP89_6470 [Schlesneria sp.]|nr:hypothetical protein [Schlesneria sp.]